MKTGELDDSSQSSTSIDLDNNNEECIIVFEAIVACFQLFKVIE